MYFCNFSCTLILLYFSTMSVSWRNFFLSCILFWVCTFMYFTSSVFHWYLQRATALCSELQNCRLVISASVTTLPLQQPSHAPLQYHRYHTPCRHHRYHPPCDHHYHRYHPPPALIRFSSQSALSPSMPCISSRMSSPAIYQHIALLCSLDV